MAITSYISHEGMQTKSSLCSQNPSMIHKTNKEKHFRSRRCVGHEIEGHEGQKRGIGYAGGNMV